MGSKSLLRVNDSADALRVEMQCKSDVKGGDLWLPRYLGADEEAWKEYDACELLKKGKMSIGSRILCDQGTDDGFLPKGQLLPGKYV